MKKLKQNDASLPSKREEKNTRRAFLKKAAYSAPVLMVLGQLAKPTTIHADGTGGPDGPPGDGWATW